MSAPPPPPPSGQDPEYLAFLEWKKAQEESAEHEVPTPEKTERQKEVEGAYGAAVGALGGVLQTAGVSRSAIKKVQAFLFALIAFVMSILGLLDVVGVCVPVYEVCALEQPVEINVPSEEASWDWLDARPVLLEVN